MAFGNALGNSIVSTIQTSTDARLAAKRQAYADTELQGKIDDAVSKARSALKSEGAAHLTAGLDSVGSSDGRISPLRTLGASLSALRKQGLFDDVPAYLRGQSFTGDAGLEAAGLLGILPSNGLAGEDPTAFSLGLIQEEMQFAADPSLNMAFDDPDRVFMVVKDMSSTEAMANAVNLIGGNLPEEELAFLAKDILLAQDRGGSLLDVTGFVALNDSVILSRTGEGSFSHSMSLANQYLPPKVSGMFGEFAGDMLQPIMDIGNSVDFAKGVSHLLDAASALGSPDGSALLQRRARTLTYEAGFRAAGVGAAVAGPLVSGLSKAVGPTVRGLRALNRINIEFESVPSNYKQTGGFKLVFNNNVRKHSDGSYRTPDGKFASKSGESSPGTKKSSDFAEHLRLNGMDVVGEELTVIGPLGKRRLDIVTRDTQGNLHGIEVKSGGATKTSYQRFTDQFINRFGASGTGTIKGQKVNSVNTVYIP